MHVKYLDTGGWLDKIKSTWGDITKYVGNQPGQESAEIVSSAGPRAAYNAAIAPVKTIRNHPLMWPAHIGLELYDKTRENGAPWADYSGSTNLAWQRAHTNMDPYGYSADPIKKFASAMFGNVDPDRRMFEEAASADLSTKEGRRKVQLMANELVAGGGLQYTQNRARARKDLMNLFDGREQQWDTYQVTGHNPGKYGIGEVIDVQFTDPKKTQTLADAAGAWVRDHPNSGYKKTADGRRVYQVHDDPLAITGNHLIITDSQGKTGQDIDTWNYFLPMPGSHEGRFSIPINVKSRTSSGNIKAGSTQSKKTKDAFTLENAVKTLHDFFNF